MLRKGAIMRTQPAHGELLSNLFLVKKDGGYHLVINLKMLNHFIPFLHFTMEGPSRLKHIMHGGDWMCKLELKDAYFSLPLDRNSRTFFSFQWKGTLRVHVPLFWTGPNTKGVVKVIENSNLSPEKDHYQSDNIFGRYVDFESHNTRSPNEPRQSYISCRIWAL